MGPVKLTSQWGKQKKNLKILVYCNLVINDIKKKNKVIKNKIGDRNGERLLF